MKIIYALIIFTFFLEKSAIAQEYGLQLYSLREQFKKDVPGTLQQIHKWGIKEIEGGGTYGLGLEEYKKMLADNKLVMVSVGADYNLLKTNPQAAVDEAKNSTPSTWSAFGYHTMETTSRFPTSKRRLKFLIALERY